MATITLPTEIITEILVRLPIKSLSRFLCVNKSWYSLIKSPNFIKLHLNQTLISNSESYLILADYSLYIADFDIKDIHNPLSFSELHHPLKPADVDVIGYCNGILCISDFTKNNVSLYNPLTKYHHKFPVKRIRDFKTDCNDRVVYGFGYDSITDDYKVFCFFQKLKGWKWKVDFCEAEVFSFKCNSWKSIENACQFDFFANHIGVYFNEAMYYVVYKNDAFNLRWRHNFIAKFDFRTDALLPVECPNFDDNSSESLFFYFSALDGCLCLLISYFPEGSFPEVQMGEENCLLVRADFWMMKECRDNEAWVRLFSIRDPQSIGNEMMISTVLRSKDGSRILLEVDGSKIGWYDLDNGTFEIITTCGLPEYWMNSRLCYLSGSLVTLDLECKKFVTKKEIKKRYKDNFLSMGFKLKL